MLYWGVICIALSLAMAMVQRVVSVPSSVTLRSVGGVFCEANTGGRQKSKCGPQKCGWNDWYKKHYEQPEKPVERVVLRYCAIINDNFSSSPRMSISNTNYHRILVNCLHWLLSFFLVSSLSLSYVNAYHHLFLSNFA